MGSKLPASVGAPSQKDVAPLEVDGQPALAVNALTKVFGLRKALNNVSLELPQGAFLSIFGPNGAGKTTLLRILATLARPSSGAARVLGFDLANDPNAVRAHIGFVSHRSLLYADLTAEENLLLAARLYGVPEPQNRVRELLATVELTARRHDVVRGFSRGMTQRLSLARALVHNPALLFLDEPYSGLDPRASQILDQQLQDLRTPDRSFCLISHDLEKGYALATHLLLLEQGRLALFAPKADLAFEEFKQRYYASFSGGAVGNPAGNPASGTVSNPAGNRSFGADNTGSVGSSAIGSVGSSAGNPFSEATL